MFVNLLRVCVTVTVTDRMISSGKNYRLPLIKLILIVTYSAHNKIESIYRPGLYLKKPLVDLVLLPVCCRTLTAH